MTTKLEQDVIDAAQVAFYNEGTWAIIAQFRSISGLHTHFSMPAVACPIVDTRPIASDVLLRKACHDHISPTGVKDLEQFLIKMERYGGIISYPVTQQECTCSPNPNREGAACPVCQVDIQQLHSSDIPY
jgi:hypothetical protein